MPKANPAPDLLRAVDPAPVANSDQRIAQLKARVAAEREATAEWKRLACEFAQALHPFTLGGETVLEGPRRKDGPPQRAVHIWRVPQWMVARAATLLKEKGELCLVEQHRAEREHAEDAMAPVVKIPAARAAGKATPRSRRAIHIA
jgi:hypothetical protein